MRITVDEIARLASGKVEGDGSQVITSFGPIEEAGPGAITFLSNPKYLHFLYDSQASAVLVSSDFQPEKAVKPALIFVEDVYTTVSTLLEQFQAGRFDKRGIEQPSFIAPSATYGDNLYLGAFAYLGEGVKVGDNTKIFPHSFIGDGVTIGDNTLIHSGVKIYAGCKVGSNCIIHAGAVIGSDGFGFAPQDDGSYKKMPQTGIVVIQDNVEIGANTTIDRATLQATVIGEGVKLDNLIQVAHNVEIGANTAIAAQTGISGSAKIGKGCIIAGQVGFVGHIQVADGTMVGAQSGVSKSITTPDKRWFGSPVDEYRNHMKSLAVFRQLPEMLARLNTLEKNINKEEQE